MAASGKTGGYNCEFIDVVPADFLCESCGLVAREPSLTVCCGKHYCQTCISHLLRDSKPCPGCGAVPFNAILDKNYQRKVLALRVHCTLKDCGCQWTGQLEQLDTHLDVDTREHLALMAAASVRMSWEFEQKLRGQRDEFQGYLEKMEKETTEQLKLKDREIRAVEERLEQSVRHLQEVFQEQLQERDGNFRGEIQIQQQLIEALRYQFMVHVMC